MTLEVRPSNEAALALYKKFGFRSVGRRPHYYTDNAEDAEILWNTDIEATLAALEGEGFVLTLLPFRTLSVSASWACPPPSARSRSRSVPTVITSSASACAMTRVWASR